MPARVMGWWMMALIVTGCGSQSKTPAPPAAGATLGDPPISLALFNYYATQKAGVPPDKINAGLQASLLEDLERLKAAAAVGESRLDAETTRALELQRLELLARAAARAAGVYASPSDADLHADYERFKASLPPREFHLAHILVATEPAANGLIIKLREGADFAMLARAQSADDSKARGGDLGWNAVGKVPVELTDAVQSLQPGQVASRPVHTAYGWHVVKLLEARAAPVPPFEEVKAQIAVNLQEARYREFLESARAEGREHHK